MNSLKHNILNLNNEKNARSLRAISPITLLLLFDQKISTAKAFGKLKLIWRINLFAARAQPGSLLMMMMILASN